MSETKPEEVLRAEDPSLLTCRYYENVYPEVDEVVIANVFQIGDHGARVTLLEYNDLEGLILLSELSRRRIRSINKLIRVNRTEVVSVLRVDKEKGYIDLSKKKVNPEDITRCEERYNKAKAVHSVMRHVAQETRLPLERIYETIGWPLYRRYGHAYDAFRIAMSSESTENILETLPPPPAPNAHELLLGFIRKKLAPQPVKLRADIQVTCYSYEGIEAIRAALLAGEAESTPDTPIKVRLIAAPLFVLQSLTLDKDAGLITMNRAVERIGAEITARGGSMVVSMAPKSLSAKEESALQEMMENMALEDEESGSEDEDDESSSSEEEEEEEIAGGKGKKHNKKDKKDKRGGGGRGRAGSDDM